MTVLIFRDVSKFSSVNAAINPTGSLLINFKADPSCKMYIQYYLHDVYNKLSLESSEKLHLNQSKLQHTDTHTPHTHYIYIFSLMSSDQDLYYQPVHILALMSSVCIFWHLGSPIFSRQEFCHPTEINVSLYICETYVFSMYILTLE